MVFRGDLKLIYGGNISDELYYDRTAEPLETGRGY